MANFWVDPVRFLSEFLLWLSFSLVCIKVVFKDVNSFFTYLFQLSDHSSKEMKKDLLKTDSSDDGVKIDTFGNYGYPLVLEDSRPRKDTSLLDYDHEQHEMNRKMSAENLYTRMRSEPYKLFGKLIDDKHRWMEDGLDSNLMKKWMSAQNKCANKLIRTRSGGIPPLMHSLRDKILEAHQLDEIDSIFQRGEHFFYYRRLRYSTKRPNILQLYMTKKLNADCFSTSRQASGIHHSFSETSTSGTPESNVLLEASEEDMTIHATWICNDGAKLAYAYSRPGSKHKDWVIIGIRDVLTGEDSPEVLAQYCHVANISLTWHSKDTGFFYSCMTEGPSLTNGSIPATAQHRVCFHRLGSQQSEDLVVCDSLLVELGDKKVPAERTIGSEAATSNTPGSPSSTTLSTSPSSATRREFFYPRMSHCSSYLLIDVCQEDVSDILCMKGPKKMRLGDRSNKFCFLDATSFDGENSSSLGSVVKLIDGRGGDFTWEYITNVEVDFFMRTNFGADHFRVVRITVPAIDHIETQAAKPDSDQRLQFMLQACWHTALEWIPEKADGSYLEKSGVAAQTVLVLKYIRGSASHDLVLYDLTQSLDDTSRRPCAELPNPPYGIIEGPYCNFYSNSIFYRSSSFSDPGSIWRANITRSSITHTVEVGFEPIYFGAIPHVNTYQFETRQEVCACSTDVDFAGFHFSGTRNRNSNGTALPLISGRARNSNRDEVPYFMVHLKDSIEEKTVVAQDKISNAPVNTVHAVAPKHCILYVYGSFGVSLVPVFSLPLLLYVKHFDAILCVVQARGGGELGKGWQEKGQGVFKQNTVADVISVASDLVEKGYTTKDMLSLMSGSFGSAIAAACLNQRPDLFAAAVMEDGIFDLLRYDNLTPSVQWFEQQTAGMKEKEAKESDSAKEKKNKSKNADEDDDDDSEEDDSDDEEDEENKTLWIEEFGSASASEEECDRLYQLSPLHNVRLPSQEQKEQSLKEGRALTFPSVLCIASSKSRVPAMHTFKYVSELQSTWGSRVESGPIMLHIDEHLEDEEDEDEDTESESDSDEESEQVKRSSNDNHTNNPARGEHHEIHEHLSRASIGLYFLASRTGAVFREDFNTEGESGRGSMMEAGFSSDDFGEGSEEASEDDDDGVVGLETDSHYRQSIEIDDDDDDDRSSRETFYDHDTSTRDSQVLQGGLTDNGEKGTSRIAQAGSALKGMSQKLRSSIASGGSSIRSSISQAISNTGSYLSKGNNSNGNLDGNANDAQRPSTSRITQQTPRPAPNLYSNQRR